MFDIGDGDELNDVGDNAVLLRRCCCCWWWWFDGCCCCCLDWSPDVDWNDCVRLCCWENEDSAGAGAGGNVGGRGGGLELWRLSLTGCLSEGYSNKHNSYICV